MKFEMTASEFECFCANLGAKDPVALAATEQEKESLEQENHELRCELTDVREDRNRAWASADTRAAELDTYRANISNEIREIRNQITVAQRELECLRTLVPGYTYKALQLSNAVACFLEKPNNSKLPHGKISAIKLTREIFGLGLKEAKECVEGINPGDACAKGYGLMLNLASFWRHIARIKMDASARTEAIKLLQNGALIETLPHAVASHVADGSYNPYLTF